MPDSTDTEMTDTKLKLLMKKYSIESKYTTPDEPIKPKFGSTPTTSNSTISESVEQVASLPMPVSMTSFSSNSSLSSISVASTPLVKPLKKKPPASVSRYTPRQPRTYSSLVKTCVSTF